MLVYHLDKLDCYGAYKSENEAINVSYETQRWRPHRHMQRNAREYWSTILSSLPAIAAIDGETKPCFPCDLVLMTSSSDAR